jgi:hypothetical protein
LDPLYGDACSAKGFEVLPLIFSTDCSLIDWQQSVLKIKSFENLFSPSFLKIRRHVWEGGNWISMVPRGRSCCSEQTYDKKNYFA